MVEGEAFELVSLDDEPPSSSLVEELDDLGVASAGHGGQEPHLEFHTDDRRYFQELAGRRGKLGQVTADDRLDERAGHIALHGVCS